MQRDSVFGTFIVAAVLCVVCSVVVSFAAVQLRPLQTANKLQFQKRNILIAAGIETDDIDKAFENIQTRLINLETGEEVEDDEDYDPRLAAKDPDESVEIPDADDIAKIGRREKLSRVYLVMDGMKLKTVILPVYGKGLWSTLYGYLALDADLETVVGLTFYEHAETPGLGGEVDNPSWKAKWPGKKLYDESGDLKIEVIKGQVVPESPDAIHQVDGLSGATITSRGVSKLIEYWLSDGGFGPFLKTLSQTEGTNG